MAFGDVYELTDKALLAGQDCINVFFYRQNNLAVTVTAQDLIDSYVGQVLPALKGTQSGHLTHTEISCRNLFNDSDRAVQAISQVGTAPNAEYHSNFDAVGWSLVQDNGSIKNGAKRVAGLPEAYSTDGVIDSATYIALLSTLSAALTGTLDFGVLATWLPVIVKRILVAAGKYRLPENSGETVYGSITDAVFNPIVTSQVSRKIGVGV